MPEELIVTPDLAMPPSEPQWRCPISGCDLEVLYPEELEFPTGRTPTGQFAGSLPEAFGAERSAGLPAGAGWPRPATQ